MDILAARKRAAERAKAEKTGPAAPAPPARDERGPEQRAPAVPPLPEAGGAPDDTALSGKEAPSMTAEPERAAPASDEPAAAAGAAHGGEKDELQEPEQEQELEMLAFLLGAEEYVLPVDRVREVLTPREITPVPHTPDHILGVCSLRGTVLPVIDLNRRLRLAAAARDEKSRIIVIGLEQDEQVGLLVDRVRGVVRFPAAAVQPVPETTAEGVGADFLQGIARKDDRLLILLDVKKMVIT